MKILWLSRHEPLPAQLAELSRRWPGYELVRQVTELPHADAVCKFVRENKIDDVVFIGPPTTMLQSLCEKGIFPLMALMEPAPGDPHADLVYSKKFHDGSQRQWSMRFVRFRRSTGVIIGTEELPEIPEERTA